MNDPERENARQETRVRPLLSLRLHYCLVSLAFGALLSCQRKETASSSPTSTHSSVEALEPKAASTCTVTLKLDMSGFGNDHGSCRVAVYLGPSHFNDPEYAIAKGAISIMDLRASWQVELQIPLQAEQAKDDLTRVAVCVYHDENENARLDKNSFGIPLERYGFSRNPKRGFGPPKFHETAIEFVPAIDVSGTNKIFEIPILIK